MTTAGDTNYTTSGGYTVDGTASSGTMDLSSGNVDLSIVLRPLNANILPSFSLHLVGDTPVRAPIANAGPDQTVECDPTTKTGSVLLSSVGSIAGSSPIAGSSWSEGTNSLGIGGTLVKELTLGNHVVKLSVYGQDNRFGTIRVQFSAWRWLNGHA